MNFKGLALLFNAVLFVATAWAGVVPGKWEKVQAEKPGTEMIISLTAGDQIRGAYQEVRVDEILITVDGMQRALPKPGIAKITTGERRMDPLWQGPLIGFAIGAAIGVAFAASDPWSRQKPALWILLPSALGAALGLGVDAAIQTRITLYKAPRVD